VSRLAAPAVLGVVLVLAGCGNDREPTAGPSGPSSTPAASTTAEPTATPSATASTKEPVPATGPTPTASSAPLAWEQTGRAVQEEVITGQGWTIVVDEERSLATLSGPGSLTVSGDKRFRVDEVLLDRGWAVVVLGDTLQQQPARATVVNLATGRQTVLDGTADPPTVNGGTWALLDGLLVHATRADGDYCLAARSLSGLGPDAPGEIVYCAADRHGFSNARLTPTSLGLMTFDDQRPSCRTLGTVDNDGGIEPVGGVEDCKGWELVQADAGPVWSVIPRPNALDEARVHATAPDGSTVDLGPATSGSLTWCAGATYFARDPQSPGEPARLMRWTDAGAFEVVYETTGSGQAFLDGPRCGGDRITVSAYAESGDQQVSAPVP